MKFTHGYWVIRENFTMSYAQQWVRTDVRDSAALAALNGELEAGTKAIYLAACHQPDMVEEQPELAWSINITALADALNRLGRVACLYYASNDSVYG